MDVLLSIYVNLFFYFVSRRDYKNVSALTLDSFPSMYKFVIIDMCVLMFVYVCVKVGF